MSEREMRRPTRREALAPGLGATGIAAIGSEPLRAGIANEGSKYGSFAPGRCPGLGE
jgi:hypothetical protein